jgi:hypothetical protein
MHWLIMHADQVIGGAAQKAPNIKIQKMAAKFRVFTAPPAHF